MSKRRGEDSINGDAENIEDPLLVKPEPYEQEEYDDDDDESFNSAGIWSRVTFRWLNPVFKKSRFHKITLSDIPSLSISETAQSSSSMLQKSIKHSSLPKAIINATWRSLAINGIFAGVNTVASYTGPFLITYFVSFLTQKRDEESYAHGVILAFIFFLSKTLESLAQQQWYFGAQRIGIQVKAALTVFLYKKTLYGEGVSADNGKITNLINVDVDRVGDFFYNLHNIWLLPVQVMLAMWILCRNLGPGLSFVSLFATFFVMTANIPLAKLQRHLHSKIMDAKDDRIKATSDSLKNMRVLKLHSWESAYLEKILLLRGIERSWVNRYLFTTAAIQFLFWTSPTLVSAITFGTCILFNTPLTTGMVLSAIATFASLREPIYNLPELVSTITQTKVSINRLQEFLGEDNEREDESCVHSSSKATMVKIEPGEYAWSRENDELSRPTLKITERFKVLGGQKIAICGMVGSGKSSLLCSIIGEISLISGVAIEVYGTKAYVPQSPWIQTGTVKENILFGKEMNEGFYQEVLERCALKPDIQMWVDGDMTVVGERGMNLSGGQKQRIQLARAIYNDSDVYILDDPFSAVDAHTGAHLFKKCLLEFLACKTVIYTTHQLEFLIAADLVLVMKDGVIVQSGKYEDLVVDLNGELVRQMTAHTKYLNQVKTTQKDDSMGKVLGFQNQIENMKGKFDEAKGNNKRSHDRKEETETGRVTWKVYSTFITCAYKGSLVPVILLCQALFQGLQMGSNYWIAWASGDKARATKEQLIRIFILLSGGSSFFILVRAVLLATIAIKTAQSLFLGMIKSVFRAQISFFDTTPSSQILTRSTSDQSTVDTDIPYRLAGLVFALIQLISVMLLISYVAWQVFPLFVTIIVISIWYQVYCSNTARELARIVANQKSPIIHHFSETIVGAATIRCFNQKERFMGKIFQVTNDLSRAAFYNFGTMEWLRLRINFLFNIVFLIALIILVSLPSSVIDPSLAGLAATYGLNMNILQSWVIWNMCNVENKMISVERILEFSNIASEGPLVIKECRPKAKWPTIGEIILENLHVQYSPYLPMVLKGVSCKFPGGGKIGVVGRTGSGKSTLIQALFRVVEPSRGRIIIDGLDVCRIGLGDLRSRLGIIPQDPSLFQGTVRTNLDPLRQHFDHEIWEVLKKCQLLEMVRRDQGLLDASVGENGEKWSVGERQLMCLARALLKQKRILVLDEATASVDAATDNAMQEIIKQETRGCTLITVAHRIPSIMEHDLLLLLDDGKVREYDIPRTLFEDKSSSFYKLVEEYVGRSTTNS